MGDEQFAVGWRPTCSSGIVWVVRGNFWGTACSVALISVTMGGCVEDASESADVRGAPVVETDDTVPTTTHASDVRRPLVEIEDTTTTTTTTAANTTTTTTTKAANTTTTTTPTTTTTAATEPNDPVLDRLWIAVDVIDGDTLELEGPDGLVRVRLIGINAAEDGECMATEARDALRFMTESRELRLISDVSDTDQYDRKLRYIETLEEVDIGGELVRLGLAIANRYEPDTARSDTYSALQTQAQTAQLGQWASDACGTSTQTAAEVEITIRYDADGDDNFNLNDEWVRFTNNGTATLNLDDWLVADESASHRYTFHDLILTQGSSVTLYTGCGRDTDTDRYWCNQRSAVWNNSGDTAFLRDPSGNNVVTKTYSG